MLVKIYSSIVQIKHGYVLGRLCQYGVNAEPETFADQGKTQATSKLAANWSYEDVHNHLSRPSITKRREINELLFLNGCFHGRMKCRALTY